MTTYTVQGYSRTIDYDTQVWGDYTTTSMSIIRPDPADSFTYHYGWIDDSELSVPMVQVLDLWSHSAMLGRAGDIPVNVAAGFLHIEWQVYSLHWDGKVTYVLAAFFPMSGVEHIFFMGGDAPPPITSLAELNAFMASERHWVQDGPYEGGNAIPLSGFHMGSMTQDDVVTAHEDTPLYWNAGIGNDTITGGTTNDTMLGGAGHDSITGGGGSDTIVGGAGNDTLTGGDGGFTALLGGEGDDVLIGLSPFGEQMMGGAGNDHITMSNGQDFGGGNWVSHSFAQGGSGDDTVMGGIAGDNAHGGAGNDEMYGNAGGDSLQGGLGNDMIYGGNGDDFLMAGRGDDSVEGGLNNDVIHGDDGADTLMGQDGNDTIMGDDGDDELWGGLHNDSAEGGAGNDRIYGENGADRLAGGEGNDSLYGGGQNDRLDGGAGNDLLRADQGNDVLLGGLGNDTLIGGAGADTITGQGGADRIRYLAATDSTSAARDRITGFTLGVDDIDLSAIDANGAGAGDPLFVFVGTGPITGAGQVRISEIGGSTYVEVEINGDTVRDMEIEIAGVTGLLLTDFIL